MHHYPSKRLVSMGRIAALVITAATIAAVALAQSPFESALVFDPLTMIQPARPPMGSSFKDLVIGRTTRPMATAALGHPTGGTGNVVEWKDTADCRKFDFECLTARFDKNGMLDQLWIQLRRPLHPRTVVSRFRLNQPSEIRPNGAQEVHMFAPAGIAMGITGGWVNALWLIHARLPPVRSAASPSPPSTDTILVPGVGADAPTTQDPVGSPPEIPGINWPVAGQDPLRPDQPAGLEDPEAGRARAVALEFLAAANRGDVAALRRLAAEDLVQRLEEQLEGQTQEDRAERQVRKLVCENDRARAEVWMKNPEVQNLYAELLATVELEHSAADWRVTRFSVKPYIRDLEEEVRP